MHSRWWAAPVLAAAVIGLAACGSSSSSTSSTPAAPAGSTSSSAPAASGSQIKTASTSVGTILENSSGHAIYWFAIDTPTKSNCTASCITYWPPVKGPVTAAAGVSLPGTFGTIKRADGTTQATYMGHPLYTYVADSAGQVGGNGKNLSGGLWWAMTPSGSKPSAGAAPQPSTSTSSGGGYGY
jgi:predicted lipoprotein with Yx(FWY)xxD motif